MFRALGDAATRHLLLAMLVTFPGGFWDLSPQRDHALTAAVESLVFTGSIRNNPMRYFPLLGYSGHFVWLFFAWIPRRGQRPRALCCFRPE